MAFQKSEVIPFSLFYLLRIRTDCKVMDRYSSPRLYGEVIYVIAPFMTGNSEVWDVRLHKVPKVQLKERTTFLPD